MKVSYWDGRRWVPEPQPGKQRAQSATRARAAVTMIVILLGIVAVAIPFQSRAGTPTIQVNPATARPGERVWVTGDAFPFGVEVSLHWQPSATAAATAQPTSRGTFRVRLEVPNLPAGTYSLTATFVDPATPAGGTAPVRSATVDFSVASADGEAAAVETAPVSTPASDTSSPNSDQSPEAVPSGSPEPVADSSTPAPLPVTSTPPPPAPAPIPVADVPGFRFVIAIYNNDGANVALGAMRPYLRSGDIFLVLSGNNGNALDVPWVNQVAARLVSGVPGTTVYAATAGTANGAVLAAGVQSPVTGVAYVYEPSMANEPEFNWDFAATQANFQTFANAAHANGLLAVGKPTGRPILEGNMLPYGWSYGTLGTIMDVQTPQFQTWCRQGLYPQALDKTIGQYAAAGRPQRWYPEISLDLGSINGVAPQTAIACSRAAAQRGLPGALMWWAPPFTNEAITYLSAFRHP